MATEFLDGPAVAIIPARGGSKGIPRKNLKQVGGRSLLGWSIYAARASRSLAGYWVSTEDEEIAAEARRLGASVIERPFNLAEDEVRLDGTLAHGSDWLRSRGIAHRYVVTLQPTSPFRRGADIDAALQEVRRRKAGSLMSVKQVECSPELMLRLNERAERFDPNLPKPFRRQDWMPVYQPNGAVYVSHVELLRRGQALEDHPAYLHMANERSVDIDTPFDLVFAEALLQANPELGDAYAKRNRDENTVRWENSRSVQVA